MAAHAHGGNHGKFWWRFLRWQRENSWRRGKLANDPLLKPVAGVSVGIVESQALLDLCYVEDVAAAVDMNLVMNGDGGEFIELHGNVGKRALTTTNNWPRCWPWARRARQTIIGIAAGRAVKRLVPGQIIGRLGQQTTSVVLLPQNLFPEFAGFWGENQIKSCGMNQPVLPRHFVIKLARRPARITREQLEAFWFAE